MGTGRGRHRHLSRRTGAGHTLLALALLATLTALVAAGPAAPRAAADPPSGLVAVDVESTGQGACAATEDEDVYCWGEDWNGMLGNGTGGTSSFTSGYATSPVLASTSGVDVGSGCAVRSDASVQCWGYTGIIEDGEGSFFSEPPWGSATPRSYGHAASSEVSGRCALHLTGTVSCQGWDNYGQVGRGGAGWPGLGYPATPPSAATAAAVAGLSDVVDLDAQGFTVCAVKGDGTVWCWGLGRDGLLGDGLNQLVLYPCSSGSGSCSDSDYAGSPEQIPGVTDAVAVRDSCALRATGAVTCWGTNTGGRFRTDLPTSTILTPTDIPAFAGAVDLAVGFNAMCGVFADGSVTCQGRGNLGDGTRYSATASVQADLNGRAVQVITVGFDSWCVRYVSGRLDCWGQNSSAQLGAGFRSTFAEPVLSPTLVVGFTGRDLITGALFELGSGGNTVKEGEATTIRLRVENLTQTTLTDVAVVGTSVVAIDAGNDGAATVGTSSGGQTLSGTLGPRSLGEHLGFADFRVVAQHAGSVRLAVTVTATGEDGSVELETFTYDLVIEPAPLLVELTVRPDGSTAERGAGEAFEFLLNENDHQNRFEVEVSITNQGDEPVESIDYLDPDAPIDFDTLLVDDQGVPIPGVAIEPLDDPVPGLPAADLDPGESMTQTYRFEGFDEAHAELSVIVLGRMGSEAVSGRGVVEVKVLTDVLVEFGMELSRSGPFLGGAPIRLDGVLRNVSEDTTVGVIAFPTTTGNAGNGNVFCPTSSPQPCPLAARTYGEGPGRTPTGPVPMVLEPGQEVPLQALLITTELPVGGTATVHWDLRVWKHEIDEDTGELVKTPAAETQIEILEDDGLDDDLEAFVPATEQLPEVIGGECAADSLFLYYGCGALVGIERLGQSLYDLARLASNGGPYVRMLAWSADYLGRLSAVLQADEAAQRAVVDQIVAEMQGYVDVGAAIATNLPALVEDAVVGFIDRWVTIAETGDYESLVFELGRMSGENPDLVLGAAALSARVGRTLLRGVTVADDPIRVAVRAAEEIRQADLAADLAAAERAAESGGPAVHRAGVFQLGDELTPRMLGDYWAADPRDVETAFDIADSEQVLLTFASRVDEAVDAVRTGLAWPTPRELPVSAVDDIDVDFLGYPASREGFADLAQPPRDFPTDTYISSLGDCCFNVLGDDAIRSASVDWVRRNHPGLDPAMAERVASRLQTRVNEFIASYSRLLEFEQPVPGTDDTIFEVPVGRADFGETLALGRDAPTVVRDSRTLRLEGRQDANFGPAIVDETFLENYRNGTLTTEQLRRGIVAQQSRVYYALSFDATGTGAFRPMVDGGVELVAVTGLDGRRIVDPAKRARVYEKLQSTLGMRNGELPDWVATGQVDPLRASVVDDALTVTVGPGREARASGFIENRTILPGTPNAGASVEDFVLIAGYGYRWLHEPAGPGPFTRPSHFDLLEAALNLPQFFAVRTLWRFVDGLSELAIDPRYDRLGGSNLRPDGDGGLEVLDPDAGGGASPVRVEGAATGAWLPISLADALALGNDPDTLELAPATVVVSGLAGSTALAVASPDELDLDDDTDWFEPGDAIVVDPGGPNEERATVASVTAGTGSLVLAAPLAREHIPGEYVVLDIRPLSVTPTARFVQALYRDLLGRAPTLDELSLAATRIDSGTPRSVLAAELANSVEWVGHLVDGYYADTLDREPDAEGRAFWIEQIRSGAWTPAQVAAAFYSSTEYFEGLGGGTAFRWVTSLYRALLDRSPDPAGRAYWAARAVQQGRLWVAQRFFDSAESRQQRVRALYLDLLGRQPDPGGLAYWSEVILRTGSDVALARDLTASDEYFARALLR